MGDHRCSVCIDFVTSDQLSMKRHVAIVHGNETFSTLRCDVCQRKFYDLQHFQEHGRESPECVSKSLMISPIPLKQSVEVGFSALVSQMMIKVETVPTAIIQPQPMDIADATAKDSSARAAAAVKGTEEPVQLGFRVVSANDSSGVKVNPNDTNTEQILGKRRPRKSLEPSLKSARVQFKTKRQPRNALANIPKSPTGEEAKKMVEERDGEHKGSPSLGDFLKYCQDVIIRRRRGDHLACALCEESLIMEPVRNLYDHSTVEHVRYHLNLRLYQCGLCNFDARYRKELRAHLLTNHNADTNQFTDKSNEHLEKFMEMFAQCFDRRSKAVQKSTVNRRSLTVKQNAPDHGASNEDGKISSSRKGRSSIGTKSSSGQKKLNTQNGPSVGTGRVVTKGKNRRLRGDQMGSQSGAQPMGKRQKVTGKKKGDGQKRPVESRRIFPQRQRRMCLEKVRKFIKDDKLQCQLCQRKCKAVIMPSKKNPYTWVSLDPAYSHAMTHLKGVKVYKCCNYCSYSTNSIWIRMHVKTCQKNGPAKFIDNRRLYYREICDKFLECFDQDAPKRAAVGSMDDGPSTAAVPVGKRDGNQQVGISCASKPVDSGPRKWFTCSECEFKSSFQKLFQMHVGIMHPE